MFQKQPFYEASVDNSKPIEILFQVLTWSDYVTSVQSYYTICVDKGIEL